MAYTIQRLFDEPIILVTVKGKLDAEMMLGIFTESAAFMREIGGHAYRITDCTEMDSTALDFLSTLKMVQVASKGMPGASGDPNLTVILVAQNHWTQLFRDALQQPQFGGISLPILPNLTDGLEFVRVMIRKQQINISAKV